MLVRTLSMTALFVFFPAVVAVTEFAQTQGSQGQLNVDLTPEIPARSQPPKLKIYNRNVPGSNPLNIEYNLSLNPQFYQPSDQGFYPFAGSVFDEVQP